MYEKESKLSDAWLVSCVSETCFRRLWKLSLLVYVMCIFILWSGVVHRAVWTLGW